MSKESFQITKNKLMINTRYKNKMKTYCVKCKKDTEILKKLTQTYSKQKITN